MVLRMEARNVAVSGLLLAAAGYAFTAAEIETKKLQGVTEDGEIARGNGSRSCCLRECHRELSCTSSGRGNSQSDDSGALRAGHEKLRDVSVAGAPEAELRDHWGAQRFVSHLWSKHLAEALPWKVVRGYRFRKPNHINILECHAHKPLMRMSPRDCRLVTKTPW